MISRLLITAFISAISIGSFAQAPQGGNISQEKGGGQPSMGGFRGGDVNQPNGPMQTTKTETFVLIPKIDKGIAQKISNERSAMEDVVKTRGNSRGLAQNLISSLCTTGISFVTGGLTDLVTQGVEAALKTFKGHREDWRKINQEANTKKDTIPMQMKINNFYSEFSKDGAMDPVGMQFDGVTIEQKKGGKTIFKLVCSLDKSKEGLGRILANSKFTLVLDTLIFDAKECELPYQKWNKSKEGFSFNDRTSITRKISIDFTSSWITPSIDIKSDVKLGAFSIELPALEKKDTHNGIYEYYRTQHTHPMAKAPVITGECFIVPRSLNGSRNPETNTYEDLYGLGEYKVCASIVTSCQNTREFEDNWKADWQNYKDYQKRFKQGGNDSSFSLKNWFLQYYSNHYANWVTAVIKAPITSSESYLKKLIEGNNDGMQGGQGGMPNGQGDNGYMNQSGNGSVPQSGQPQGGQNNGGQPAGEQPQGQGMPQGGPQ